jgi:hypothetical protein
MTYREGDAEQTALQDRQQPNRIRCQCIASAWLEFAGRQEEVIARSLSKRALIDASSVMSATPAQSRSGVGLLPAADRLCVACRSRSAERPAIVTDAPCPSAKRAVSNPIPELPPMITTRLPSNRIAIPS